MTTHNDKVVRMLYYSTIHYYPLFLEIYGKCTILLVSKLWQNSLKLLASLPWFPEILALKWSVYDNQRIESHDNRAAQAQVNWPKNLNLWKVSKQKISTQTLYRNVQLHPGRTLAPRQIENGRLKVLNLHFWVKTHVFVESFVVIQACKILFNSAAIKKLY